MKKSLLYLIALAAVFSITISDTFAQGNTTASMRGRVVDNAGEALIGATVMAVHMPTGSQWGNVTDVDGYFRLPAMRVGGPYKITVSYIGYQDFVREGISLSLGQTFSLDVTLSEAATELQEIVVSALGNEVFDGNRTGAETYVSQERIQGTPTVSRAIGDFVRFTPQAVVSEGNDGLSISIAGQNNRYNAIYIDGAVNNDVFGLAGSGTNGGQTGVSPISLDAIEQFQVSIAPFDVRQSGFAGGSVNMVTRSGSNEVSGSAYYLFRNENLAGLTPQESDQTFERTKLPEFSAQTYGAWVSGPIIKNKLFYFVSVEQQQDETPQPFNLENYSPVLSGAKTLAEAQNDINRLVTHLEETYGYDAGVYDANTAFLNSDKVLAKIDWNINDNNKLSARHSYTRAENLEARNSSGSGIRFINGSEYFNSVTNSASLELKSSIGNNMFNHLTVGATFVRDDRDPYDNTNAGTSIPFPALFIDDGRGSYTFGSETFSTANLLNQDIITINDNFEYFKGRHTIVAGVNFEFYRTKNLFIPFNYGDYEWDRSTTITGSDLDDFINGENSSFFIRSYSLKDNVVGDESAAGVEFTGALWGFYIQDEFQATDNLKLTLGLRGDVQTFSDTPENADFNENTIPLLEQEYDLGGAKTGQFIKPQLYIAPRFGFNWDLSGDKSKQLRGGIGIFTSRIPLVWPGGAYNNNGLNRGTYLGFGTVPFEPDINNQEPGPIDPDNPTPSGDVDIFVEDFKIPQVAKFNLAYDQKLPWGMIGTIEGLYTATINNVYYQNVNLKPSNGNITGGPDTRPTFDRRDEIDPTYGRIILGSNTKKGYSYNITAELKKGFDNGFAGSFAYSYGDSYSIYDGSSSQNSSQWRGLHAINGRNYEDAIGRSFFSQGHRIIAQFNYLVEYAGFMATQIGLVYEGRSGSPTSYIYGNGQNLQNEDTRNRALIWIPANQSEINLIDYTDGDGNTVTAAQQWAQLDAFIASDAYLNANRGGYAERGQNRSPFSNVLDLRILQDFYIETAKGKKNTLQVSIDIFNFTNMLNKNWGKIYNGSFNGLEAIEFEGFEADGTTPQFTYLPWSTSEPNNPFYGRLDDTGLRSSRWQMQIGLRYRFN